MIEDIIPPGRFEVVVAAAEDSETQAKRYMRRLTLVVIGPMRNTRPNASLAEYLGGVLYAFPCDHEPATFLWEGAVNNPRDFVVGQKFIADVIRENLGEHGWRNKVGKLELRDGDDKPPSREVEYQAPEPEEPAHRIRRESASRRSAMEEARDRIESTIEEFLMETADSETATEPQPYADRRGVHGVSMPRDISAGQIMSADGARRLGAQMIRAADLHDNLLEAGR